MRPSREDVKQDVDDIFLTNKDRDEKVGEDSIGNLSCVRLVFRRKNDEDEHVGRERDAEEPSVNGKEHIAEISNRLGVLFLDVLAIEISLPPGGCLFVGDISKTTTARGGFIDGTPSFRSSNSGIDSFRSLNDWFCGEYLSESK